MDAKTATAAAITTPKITKEMHSVSGKGISQDKLGCGEQGQGE